MCALKNVNKNKNIGGCIIMKNLFVSDIHGYDENLTNQLMEIIKSDLPDKVICLGDINGSPELDAMQPIFYNKVVNYMKALLKINPNPTDDEILSFSIGNGKTISDGVKELWNFIHQIYDDFEPINTANYAKELVQYTHYGHFISCLPTQVTDIIKKHMTESVKKTLSILSKFVDAGSEVIILEGNWDISSPVDFYPNPLECKRLPVENRALYLKEFVRNTDPRIYFIHKITEIEDENNYFVFLPFDEAINYKSEEIRQPKTDKQIVLISHTQVLWSAIKGDTAMTGESKKIEENMNIILHDLLPDAVIHGHLHDKANDYNIFMEEKPVKVFYLPKGTLRFIP